LEVTKRGSRPRLIYQHPAPSPRMSQRRSFTEADYAALLDAVYRLRPSANELDRSSRWPHLQRSLQNLTKYTNAGLTGLMKTRTGRML
jgi:hypothetical protein